MQIPLAPTASDNPDQKELRRTGRQVARRLEANADARKIDVAGADLWVVPGFITPLECDVLVAMIDSNAQPSMIGVEQSRQSHRTSESADLNPDHALVRGVQSRIDDLLGIPSARGETLQGQRYRTGQQFKPHVDWFEPHTDAWHAYHAMGGQRTFTAMAYLNQVGRGGETDFPALDIAIHPRPGALLIWNNADRNGVPNPLTIHAGNPVLRGAKYVVTKWYRCRSWHPMASA